MIQDIGFNRLKGGETLTPNQFIINDCIKLLSLALDDIENLQGAMIYNSLKHSIEKTLNISKIYYKVGIDKETLFTLLGTTLHYSLLIGQNATSKKLKTKIERFIDWYLDPIPEVTPAERLASYYKKLNNIKYLWN